ncbi:MAG: hypothetical protein IIX89_00840 [Oscillospiraceae bacterium]|nr:hypothetical protein [Oscillospiraceae bacterium]
MKTKRIISAVVAVAMMICALPLSAFASSPQLELDTPTTIVAGDRVLAATFTPAEDGLYEFASASVNEDAPANAGLEILDSTYTRIDYVIEYQDFQGFDFYFSAYLTKGEQYTLRMQDSHSSADGFTVTVSKAEVGKLEIGKSAVTIPGESISYLTLTPEKDGKYMLTSQKVTEADARFDRIVDEDGESPVDCDNDSNSDDYVDREFYVAYELKGGKTYTMAFYDYSGTDDGFYVSANNFHKIIDQPTAAKPSVELNSTEGASYQWHKTTAVSAKLGPDDNKLMMTSAVYDNGKWSTYSTQIDDVYSYDLMYVELKENEEMTIKSSDALLLDKCQIVNANTLSADGLSITAADSKTVKVKALQSAIYWLILATDAENSEFEVEYAVLTVGDAIQGQTTDALTKFEKYAGYACLVSFDDGTKLQSNIFIMNPVVVKQPTAAKPSVEVNFADDVKSYQWYEVEQSFKTVTDEDVSGATSDVSYDSDTGRWTATPNLIAEGIYGYSLFNIELKKGDIIKIQSNEDVVANHCFLGGMIGVVEAEIVDGDIVFTASENSVYNLYIASQKNDSTFSIQILDNKLKDKIADQTTASLTKFEKDAIYACVVTYVDGVELTSDVVKTVPAITKQPTSVEPSVEVNLPEDAKGYQWYEIVKGVLDDKKASAYEYDGGKSSYDSQKGVWKATTDSYNDNGYFEIEAKEGDVIYVQIPADVEFELNQYLGFENKDTFNCFEDHDGPDDNGIFEIEIEEDGTCYLYATFDTEIKAWMQDVIKLEGETAKELTKAEAGKEYFCIVAFDGADIASDSFISTEVTELSQSAANVDINDKAAQKELVAKVDELLKKQGLTDSEKAMLNEIKAEAQKNVAAIEAKEKAAADKAAADKVAKAINAIPENLTKADAEAVAAAKKAYDELTEEQRSLISDEVKERLAAAVAEIESLDVPAGDTDKPSDVIAPETGDNSALFAWMMAMFVAALAVGCLAKKKTAK